jgi:acyl-CoA synthetase (AMP-forming)/AMP-acid ligase II
VNIAMLLEMAGEAGDGRVAVGDLSYPALLDQARRAGAWLAQRDVTNVGLVDVNSEAGPIALFGAAIAGRPFAPVNYRWSDDQHRRRQALGGADRGRARRRPVGGRGGRRGRDP